MILLIISEVNVRWRKYFTEIVRMSDDGPIYLLKLSLGSWTSSLVS